MMLKRIRFRLVSASAMWCWAVVSLCCSTAAATPTPRSPATDWASTASARQDQAEAALRMVRAWVRAAQIADATSARAHCGRAVVATLPATVRALLDARASLYSAVAAQESAQALRAAAELIGLEQTLAHAVKTLDIRCASPSAHRYTVPTYVRLLNREHEGVRYHCWPIHRRLNRPPKVIRYLEPFGIRSLHISVRSGAEQGVR